MITITPGSGLIKPVPLSEFDFTVEMTTQLETLSSASSTEVVEQDMVVDLISAEKTRVYAEIVPVFIQDAVPGDISIAVSDDVAATVVGNKIYGTRTDVGTDVIDVAVRCKSVARGESLSIVVNGSQDYRAFNRYSAGSLGKHCTDQLDALAATPGRSLDIFTTYPSRNPSCWAASLDMTGVMAYRGSSTKTIGSVAINTNIVTGCSHAMFSIGSTVSFIDDAGATHTRTLTDYRYVPCNDLVIWKLNSALPASIKIYKTLPLDWLDYLPSIPNRWSSGTSCILPTVCFKKNNQVIIRDVDSALSQLAVNCGETNPASEGVTSFYRQLIHDIPEDSDRAGYSAEIISGDSAHPCFIIINGELVWVGNHWGPTAIAYPCDQTAEIEAAIEEMTGTRAEKTTVDLTEFTNYG